MYLLKMMSQNSNDIKLSILRSAVVPLLFLKCPFLMKHGHKIVYDKMKQVCTIL